MTEQPEPVTTPTAVQQAVERLTKCGAAISGPLLEVACDECGIEVDDLRTVLAALADAETAVEANRLAMQREREVRVAAEKLAESSERAATDRLAAAEARLAEMRAIVARAMGEKP